MRPIGKPTILLLALVFGTIDTGLAQAPKPDPTPVPAAPPITLPLTALVPDAAIELAGDLRLAVTPDAVWVSNRAAGTLTKIDPKTNKPAGVAINVGQEPCYSVVSAFKSLWTALCGPKTLARIEPPPDPPASQPKPDEKPAPAKPDEKPVPSSPKKADTSISTAIRGVGPLVSATGSIWMITDPAGSLVRIDPDTNAVVAEVTIPAGASSIAVSGDALWIASTQKSVVTRVNGYSNVVEETVKVGPSPVAIASGEGSIWTLNGGDGSVSRIDPKTNKVTETIKAGVTTATGSIAVGEGSVWISAPGTPLARIDPRTNRLAQVFTGPGGGVITIGLKSLWITATPAAVWRVDPKRVEATRK